MLSIFSCSLTTCMYGFFEKMSVHILCPIVNWIVWAFILFFAVELYEFFLRFEYYRLYDLQVLSPIYNFWKE